MSNTEYLARRYKRYLSSGCVLCWDVCFDDKPFLPNKEEKRAYKKLGG